jgi:uncharacterized iron-regulated membrane protein
MKSGTLIKWHGRLGLIAAVALMLSSLSGMLHPLMVRLQPAPAKTALDHRVPALDEAMAPGRLLATNDISEMNDLRIVHWAGESYYQVTLTPMGPRHYFRAIDGALLADGDRKYAEHLAREFVGEAKAPVRGATIIDAFDWEYPRINRLLPVWRVEFDRPDKMRAYVDTRTGRLGTLVNRTKAFSSVEFAILHRWQWLEAISPVARVIALSLILAAAITVTLSGIWLYVARWSQISGRWNLRRVHRVWGISVSLASLIFVLSGGYHLLYMGIRGDAGERAPAPIELHRAADLKISPAEALKKSGFEAVEAISLARLGGRTYYRVQPALPRAGTAHHHGGHIPHGKVTPGQVGAPPAPAFVSALDGEILSDGLSRFAAEIARNAVAAEPVGKAASITEFDQEYGFAFKRLPVLRVNFAGNVAAYVDPADGAIAAVIDSRDFAEGWIFGNIHKLDWLINFAGTAGRDLVAALLALALAITAFLGIALFIKQARAARRLTHRERQS